MKFLFDLLTIIVYVLIIISIWKIFQKAGRKGWEAIIPFYHAMILFKVSKLSPWLGLLFAISRYFIMIYNNYPHIYLKYKDLTLFFIFILIITLLLSLTVLILYLIQSIKLAKAFSKSNWYGLGLAFLPGIFYPHLAFSGAKYLKD